MTFEFRGVWVIRLAFIAGAISGGVGCLSLFAGSAAAGTPWLLVPAIPLAAITVWLTSLAVRSGRSGVVVREMATDIEFAGIVSLTILHEDLVDVGLARHPWWGGLGARIMPGGIVVLSAATGEVAELTLTERRRIWLVPFLFFARTSRLRLGVRNPQALVDRLREGR
ncbi:MAG: hypothetical protein ACE5EF_08390 [Dehalococcoidia bacterium]